tara:strand:- start:23946 stop:24149 length:204 start_codon:yes stop_codon:yes gene_type:complete
MKNNTLLNTLRQTKDSYYEVPKSNNETSINDLLYNFKVNKNNVSVNDGISEFLKFVKDNGYKMKIYK